MTTFFYALGVISLILAPFSGGITVVTAAAFFVIGYVISRSRRSGG